ncbi:MAG TPA: ATP-binding cassette domain-containing protein [Planctomycetes bacterium]|nr:ATP-binding cassette domain-containing protein [Planctomycetota bacterium]HIN80895.1 ATP-binding cassette domain-containing protein [Planctomycetota bacterium]
MIKLQNVHKRLGGRAVLAGFDLDIGRGETLVLLGRSGTGKSVTLRHIVGLMQPDQGHIEVLGSDISTLKGRELMKHRRRIGYLFQDGALLNWLNLGDNVALPLRENMLCSASEIEDRVFKVLSQVELEQHADKLPSEISGGMRKRAGLARALVCNPEIVLYDEPTSGLDPISSSLINRLIDDLKSSTQITQVVVTHDMASAFEIGDRIALLHEGKVRALGTADEVRNSSDPAVSQFIHGRIEGPLAREPLPEPQPETETDEGSDPQQKENIQ